MGKPLAVVLILLGAFVVSRLLRHGITRIGERVKAATAQAEAERRGEAIGLGVNERASQRAETLTGVLRSVASIVVYGIAILMILGEIGIDIAPLIASAGIAGVALGFGAQDLVKDFLTGIFMLTEDQFGVGDVVDVGEAVGVVEKVSLRVTTVRALDGTLWHVSNGEILRVGNMSQMWSRAVLDIGVAYGTDIQQAEDVMQRVGRGVLDDPEWGPKLKEAPEVLGVEDLAADAVTIRLMIKTEPGEQWAVQRHIRRLVKDAFDAEGVEIPFPQRAVWLRNESA
ncbi:MAG: mechanosensitive ion channel family protein [Acidimicrobiia bacterium]|nr:mechanosensitive ion channel family protein [Acidimicrobiia bacterium]